MLKCPHFRVRTGYKPTQTLMKKKKNKQTNKKNKQNTRKKEKKKDRTKNNKSRVTRCSLAIVIYTERR